MDNNDNILQRIREILGGSASNFSILEHQVDVKVQMEYFEFSKNHPPDTDFDILAEREHSLYSDEIENEEKKALLVSYASIEKPEAYRILERFSSKAPAELKDWALMALQESRMLLETRLLDEQQVFISTGLGGKGGKLRYFVVIFSSNNQEYTPTQQRLIKSEFEFNLKRFHSEIEEVKFFSSYATIISLVPLSVHVKKPFETAIEECNSLGEFIQAGFLITNVKVLDDKEITDLVNKPHEKYPEEE